MKGQRLIVVVAVVLYGSGYGADPAAAYTSVSGMYDSAAPLVIDPATDPGTPLTTITPSSSALVMFVQSMPVTKVVTEVTLGDLALPSGCAPGTANVKIEEHPTGELVGNANIFYSLGSAPVSNTPSKLTWQFAPLTMRKGRGYAFRVSVSGCHAFSHTTWPHNYPQVNPGPARCTGGPGTWRRMWHVQGDDDAVPGCVDRPPTTRKFRPHMPGGWLVSRSNSGTWDVTYYEAPSQSPCYFSYPNSYDDWGGTSIFWEVDDAYPFWNEYVCQWTQFAAYGTTVPDGWYYAQPWLKQPHAAPRDTYLRLGTADDDSLLDAHAPVLLYDAEETFHAVSPGATTDFYDATDDPDDPEDANRLVDSFGAFGTANPSIALSQGIDHLTLDYLGPAYSGVSTRHGTTASPEDFLSERGDGSLLIPPFGFSADGYAADSAYMEALPGYANRVYGRVVRDENVIWLQYWIYYYFDSQGSFGHGPHEGDWEMVQVGLDESTLQPLLAAYAQHADGEMCGWPAMSSVDGHPLVYVSRASHASYFRAGHYEDPSPDDDAHGDGAVMSPTVDHVLSDSPSWMAWPGRWGDSDASPEGPTGQGLKWDDPGVWAAQQSPCDVD